MCTRQPQPKNLCINNLRTPRRLPPLTFIIPRPAYPSIQHPFHTAQPLPKPVQKPAPFRLKLIRDIPIPGRRGLFSNLPCLACRCSSSNTSTDHRIPTLPILFAPSSTVTLDSAVSTKCRQERRPGRSAHVSEEGVLGVVRGAYGLNYAAGF